VAHLARSHPAIYFVFDCSTWMVTICGGVRSDRTPQVLEQVVTPGPGRCASPMVFRGAGAELLEGSVRAENGLEGVMASTRQAPTNRAGARVAEDSKSPATRSFINWRLTAPEGARSHFGAAGFGRAR